VVVAAGMDAADDWIAERAARGTIVVTQDIPLAARAVKRAPSRSRRRQAVLRKLHRHDARDAQPDGPAPLGRRDHRRAEAVCAEGPIGVLQSLEREIVRLKREG